MDRRIIVVGVVLVVLQLAVGAAAFSASSSADNARQELDVARGDIQKLEARIKVLEKKSRIDFGAPEESGEDGQPAVVRRDQRGERVAALDPNTPEARIANPNSRARQNGRTAEVELAEMFDPNTQPEVREKIQGLVRDELAIEREERHKRRTERMKERAREDATEFAQELGLGSESTEAFSEYIVAEREKAMELWRSARDSDMSRDEIRAQMEELREETDREVAVLLDEDQYKDYLAKREEEAERFRGRGRGGRGGGRGGRGGGR